MAGEGGPCKEVVSQVLLHVGVCLSPRGLGMGQGRSGTGYCDCVCHGLQTETNTDFLDLRRYLKTFLFTCDKLCKMGS